MNILVQLPIPRTLENVEQTAIELVTCLQESLLEQLEIMPFTQKAFLLLTMPDHVFNPENLLCKEIVYELMLEPWVYESLSQYLSLVSPS